MGTGLMIHAKVSLPSSMLLFCSRGPDDVGEIFCLLATFPFVFNFLLLLSVFLTGLLEGVFLFVEPMRFAIKKINQI
jgi:hypothetical protein